MKRGCQKQLLLCLLSKISWLEEGREKSDLVARIGVNCGRKQKKLTRDMLKALVTRKRKVDSVKFTVGEVGLTLPYCNTALKPPT